MRMKNVKKNKSNFSYSHYKKFYQVIVVKQCIVYLWLINIPLLTDVDGKCSYCFDKSRHGEMRRRQSQKPVQNRNVPPTLLCGQLF